MRDSRVLVIDDSGTIRAMVEELLVTQAQCRQVAMAPDVPTARALIRSFRPTLITLDLHMPGIDGMAMLDELRGYRHAPIVVVSSATADGSEAAAQAIERGADACFDKSKIVSESKRFIRVLTKASVAKLRSTRAAIRGAASLGPYEPS